ncbi:MAG: PHP domain-containing protein, partial [Atribacterota bacterium]
MIKIVGDLHVHSVASGHAFSTIQEIARVAGQKKMSLVGFAEHGPSMPGGPSPIYFEARGHFPRQIEGVKLFFGAEVDILDDSSTLDLDEKILKKIDYAIVSLHPQVFQGQEKKDYTSIILKTLDNPFINVIAHLGNPRYPLDYKTVVKEAISRGKIIEINNSSFSISRKGSYTNCKIVAQEVKSQEGYVVVS